MASLSKITLRGYRESGTPIADIALNVFEADASGQPVGDSLYSTTISSGALGIETPTTVSVEPGIDLVANYHAITLSFAGYPGVHFGPEFVADYDANDEAAIYSDDGGTSWSFGLGLFYEAWIDGEKRYYTTLIGDIGWKHVSGNQQLGVWFVTSDLYTFQPPVPSGLNAMKTLRRLVAFAKNSVFYEV